MIFSDIRMKENIRFVEHKHGVNWYAWDWNEVGEMFGLTGSSAGVLAHEVHESHPEAVHELGGYLAVDYARLAAETVEAA